MKTIVLDDDPTGTQSASNVTVLLDYDVDLIAETLRTADAVYLQTNSRALPEEDAIRLVERIRHEGLEAAARLGEEVRFVLRGDSTLRGHVFAETNIFLSHDAVMLFVPAFPAGGRVTEGGVHYVQAGNRSVPVNQTEYAADPVFAFRSADLVEYVAEKSDRPAVPVPLSDVRAGKLAEVLSSSQAGSVVVPDAVTERDIRIIARAVQDAEGAGARVVVRSASPLAAELAGVSSSGLLALPLIEQPLPTLLVCGSHTDGARAQLRAVEDLWQQPRVVRTQDALESPADEGARVADLALDSLKTGGLAVISSERDRSESHGTLHHGAKVMEALTESVKQLTRHVEVVISKGGITSASVAREGLGARRGHVLGQILPGVSAWRLQNRDGGWLLYVVVPGNVGDASTLVEVLHAVGINVEQK